MHLRDVRARLRAKRLAVKVEAQAGERRIGEARAPVGRRRAIELDRVAALGDPARAQRRQSLADVDARAGVGVGARRVVDDDRRIRFGPERRRGLGLRDLAHRDAHVGARALDVDLARRRQWRDGGLVDVRVAGVELVVGVHSLLLADRFDGGRSGRPGRPPGRASLRRHYPDQVHEGLSHPSTECGQDP
jgi:hypothetical protein